MTELFWHLSLSVAVQVLLYRPCLTTGGNLLREQNDVAFSGVSWIPNVKGPMDHDLWYMQPKKMHGSAPMRTAHPTY
ncbi:uncharacterized [Lates japonicus]